MEMTKIKISFRSNFLRCVTGSVLSGIVLLFLISCASTERVYYPPRFDLARLGRLGIITFSDNARPSVGDYATQQFQSEIQTAQVGIPIVELGAEKDLLKNIGSSQLDIEAFKKIAQQYKVAAVFYGDVNYSDIKTNVNLNDITRLDASLDAKLDGTLSVKMVETESGATLWSDSTTWNRKLGKVSVNKDTGVSVGFNGYEDAYRKLIPDMVHSITHVFRGRYVRERVKK